MADTSLLNLLDQNGALVLDTQALLDLSGLTFATDDRWVDNVNTTAGLFRDNSDGTWTFVPFEGWDGSLTVSFDVHDGDVTTPVESAVGPDDVSVAPDVITIGGDDGNNRLTGTDGSDLFVGGAGDDVMNGGAGDDVFLVNSEDGLDSIIGGAGEDTILAGDGDDRITLKRFTGDKHVEVIDGGAGDNIVAVDVHGDFSNTELRNIDGIEGSDKSNSITGSDGDDVIAGLGGDDVLKGGAGDDVFLVNSEDGLDSIIGGAGEDTILAGDGDDRITLKRFTGDKHVEVIDGGAGDNIVAVDVHGDFSNTELRNIDAIEGSDKKNSITGSDGDDVIAGFGGDDVLKGGAGDDVFLVNSEDGLDSIIGGAGEDTILAGDGDDRITLKRFTDDKHVEVIDGGAGENTVAVDVHGDFSETELRNIDAIEGSDKSNSITGSKGDDVIVGHGGDDELDGGTGDDTLVYNVSNNLGDFDSYDGNAGQDTLRIELSAEEAADYGILAEIEEFQAYLENDPEGQPFTFASFGLRVENVEKVDITVDGKSIFANYAPEVTDTTSFTIDEDGTLTFSVSDLLANAVDQDGDPLNVTNVTLSEEVGVLVQDEEGSWSYQPPENWNGELNLSYMITDGEAEIEAGATVNVASVNDQAVVAGSNEFTIDEDGNLILTSEELLSVATDADGDPLSVTGIIVNDGYGLLVDNGDGTWSFTPPENWNGALELSYGVSDGQSEVSASALVTVSAVNDEAIVGAAPEFDMDEDGSLTITADELLANVTDVDGDVLTVVNLEIAEGEGALVNNGDGTWTFTPAEDWNGDMSLSYGVSDGASMVEAQAIVHVDAVNDAAVVDAVAEFNMDEDGTLLLTEAQLLAHASDVDGDDLSVANLSVDPSTGSVTDNGDGTWTFVPAADWNGTLDLSFGVDDGTVVTDAAARITVDAVNDDAVAGEPKAYSMNEDGTLVLTAEGLLEGATDVDGDDLSVANLSVDPSVGTVTDNGDGTWTFTPAADWSGVLTLSYDISDGTSLVPASASVTVIDLPDSIIEGSEKSETLTGTDDDDLIIGQGGDDVLMGGAGDDTFQIGGDEGQVSIIGGEGVDTILGTEGDDRISLKRFTGDKHVEVIDGGAGENIVAVDVHGDFSETELRNIDGIEGSDKSNTITGSDGNDTIAGLGGDDILDGGAGDDVFLVNSEDGLDSIIGGEGDDTILAGDGDDRITLKRFTDDKHVEVIDGGAGENVVAVDVHGDFSTTELRNISAIEGSDKSNTITGSDGNDTIAAFGGDDVLDGGAGDDVFLVNGDEGLDSIIGGEGEDTILAGDGDDRITLKRFTDDKHVEVIDGGAGTNTVAVDVHGDFSATELRNIDGIEGSDKANSITGSDGDDIISGLEGDDELAGGAGNDAIDGGADEDTAVFSGDARDYNVTFNDDGTITVEDTREGSPDGTDTLSNIEKIEFADGRVDANADAVEAAQQALKSSYSSSSGSSSNSSSSSSSSSILENPTLTQPSEENDIVAVRFENTGDTATDGGPVTLGQVFAPGDIVPGEYLMASIDGAEVPVQMDVLATHDDGSVRHAVLTIDSPGLEAGENVDIMLSTTTEPASNAVIAPQEILANGLDMQVDVTLKNDDGSETPISFDVAELLADAIESGQISTWLQGPLASEYTITAPVTELMDVTFNIRAFSDGNVMTDVVFAADKAFTPGNENFTYDVKITEGGEVAFSYDDLEHHHKGTWHQEIWAEEDPGVHVIRDMDYFQSTGAIANYDFSLGLSEDELQQNYENMLGSDTDPMGTATVWTYMPATGGRDDLGLLPEWAVQYLATQDERAEEILFANADAAGSIPWHYTDEATGEAVTIDDHPKLWLDERGGTTVLPDAFTEEGTDWSVDTAHLPSLNYLPYLLSGSQYHLNELEAQSAYVMAWGDPYYRGDDVGKIYGQVRGQAWSTRDVADAAYILPDDAPLKSYFEQKLDYNLQLIVSEIAETSPDVISGLMVGAAMYHPWQDDFYSWVIGTIAARGNELAQEISEWKAGYTAGRYLAEDFGFDPGGATSYYIETYVDGYDSIFTDWQELSDFNTDLGNLSSELGGYAMTSRAALATLVNLDAKGALEAYGYVATETPKGLGEYLEDTKMSIAIQLGDDDAKLLHEHEQLGTDGNDTLTGSAENELLLGADGDDFILGMGGVDALFGGEGNDTLDGGDGQDYLYGNDGNDMIIGGAGDDEIKGGKGADILEGGEGSDTFIYDRLTEGGDTITDFEVGVDVLDLREVMMLAGDDATVNLVQGDSGAEVWLTSSSIDDLHLTTLEGINANNAEVGNYIWV